MKSLLERLNPSLKLALIYLLFSVTWILASDELVIRLANHDEVVMERLQSFKGLVFVCLSSIVLYFSSRRINRSLTNTLRKKRELLKKFQALSKATKEGIIEYDFATDTAWINEQMMSMIGAETARLSSFTKFHQERIHTNDKERVNQNFDHFLQGGESVWITEYRYRVGKEYRDVISRGSLIRDERTGKPLHMIVALQDVTEIRDIRARYYEQRIQFKQSLARSIIEAQEKERNRWAEELHDNVCQVLTVAKLYLEQAAADYPESPVITKSSSMVLTALNDIRKLSATIKPPEFSITGLHGALNELVGNFKRFHLFNYELKYDPATEESLSDEQKLMIYRVVQEQLTNIMKYAQAKNVFLSINVREGQVFISIKDDGRGFNIEEVKSGIGLKNIRSRLQVFNGNLQIHTSPSQGCALEANFNLH